MRPRVVFSKPLAVEDAEQPGFRAGASHGIQFVEQGRLDDDLLPEVPVPFCPPCVVGRLPLERVVCWYQQGVKEVQSVNSKISKETNRHIA